MNRAHFEIERKYLVKGEFRNHASSSHLIRQGYLSTDVERLVRIRIHNNQGFITVKGEQKGIGRFEWEKEIAVPEAEKLLLQCLPHIIEKTRHIVYYKDQRFEVDEFHGDNDGLIIAEIELTEEDMKIDLPDWIGREVSLDTRYTNSYISRYPFISWDSYQV